jgi:hypothetical protein
MAVRGTRINLSNAGKNDLPPKGQPLFGHDGVIAVEQVTFITPDRRLG